VAFHSEKPLRTNALIVSPVFKCEQSANNYLPNTV